ncbi:MAG: cell envelope integrity protein CreD [Methylophaga sp.]|nr:MAG: cell envelope integrity protein CreD [Methylophaga sp.]
MEYIFGLIGILFLLAGLAGIVFFALFMARKVGFFKPNPDGYVGNGNGVKRYLSDFKRLSNSLVFRFGLIAVLVGLMNIPLSMVEDIIHERSSLHHSVLYDISNTWGQKQVVRGPALIVPYTEKIITVKVHTDTNGFERKVNKTTYKQRTAIILPEDLNIKADLISTTKKRSLYEALVYTADIKISGHFQRPNINNLSEKIDTIHWDKAWFTLGISDSQAINSISRLSWNSNNVTNQQIDFGPSTKLSKAIPHGFHAPIDLSASELTSEQTNYNFSLSMNINGSEGFYFSPLGKKTNVNIVSDWPHPSFQGNVLPVKPEITTEGFDANWSVTSLARSYPQMWTVETENHDLNEFTAGVDLFEADSLYSKITRSIKYGSLFFILTYITFLLFELGIQKRLHLVQYGMIGLALSMFYLTLLSLAEQTSFFIAYIAAASIIISMISLYSYAALKSVSRTSLIAALLSGLYFMLYSLLKLEDHALMGGTALLLIILAVMMYLTRNIGKETV